VHLDLGAVYTSLQTGVIDMSENVMSVYSAFHHYEVAPVVSLTGHEANMSLLWASQKAWDGFTPQQRGWVDAAAGEVMRLQPDQAFALEHATTAKLTRIGVKLVEVDTSGFVARAAPIQDRLAAGLGPQAAKLLELCRRSV
jgi:TRAP-type C4-dicarboxylate transport system substrate-binding protein